MPAKKTFTEDQLTTAALDILQGKISDWKVAQKTGIGRQQLRRKMKELKGVYKKKERFRKLILKDQKSLVKVIKEMSDSAVAPMAQQVKSFVSEYAVIHNIKNQNYKPTVIQSKRRSKQKVWFPSRSWLRTFLKRNNLSRKRTKGMHIGRFKNIKNPFLTYSFYDLLEKDLTILNIFNRPECIWNLDESGFPLDPANTETISLKGQQIVKLLAGSGHENITILAACNAAGQALPPLIVYSSQVSDLTQIPVDWLGDNGFALPDTCYGLSKSGWMTAAVFESWFTIFAGKTKPNRPLLLILDGHISHFSSNTITKAKAENISIVKLPSHTTSRLQPLDISVFEPLKTYWKQE
ncbi:UNVERIFIED_CONTAM: hypothetical protein RMT77_017830 [Armadillidium vulgare]